MQDSFRFDVKACWLLLATSTLLAYSIAPVRDGAPLGLDAVSTWLQIVLFLLTFPLGTFFVTLVHTLAGGFGDFGVGEQFQTWVVAIAAGYVQWFFLVPALLRRKSPGVTALNLSAGAVTTAAPAPARSPGALPESAAGVATANAPPIPQFDERGRTPFERVLGDVDDADRTR